MEQWIDSIQGKGRVLIKISNNFCYSYTQIMGIFTKII